MGQNSYSICIGAGRLADTGQMLKELGCTERAVIITDPMVRNLYGISLKQSLTGTGFKTVILEVPEGEEQKSLESAGRLYNELTEFGAERLTPILALGGGVIGDLAGFVAATYMRGVPLVQLPTTLLAQVDSSIGGKVAVNHGQLKNKIGNFYQPRLVIADTTVLQTLPTNELSSGLGEVIKYAVINSNEFFAFLEENIEAAMALDDKVLADIVARSAQIKVDVVQKDELDLGTRNVLNFGHTIGHAIETVSDFSIAHGQAVAIGMLGAAGISHEMGILPFNAIIRMRRLLKKTGLMTTLPNVDIKKVIEAMKHDKKVQGGKIKFVLPRTIGQVFISDEVSLPTIEKALVGLR
jgi:3-dehydroquinate synthase